MAGRADGGSTTDLSGGSACTAEDFTRCSATRPATAASFWNP
ncbi:MAG: hypothetical protein R2844_03840 [Caldilineales bacterium]